MLQYIESDCGIEIWYKELTHHAKKPLSKSLINLASGELVYLESPALNLLRYFG